MNATWTLHEGDVLKVLRELPDESVNCVVTSPPYWGLRDYGTIGQLGLESTPQEFVCNLVSVFREVRRVLRSDGTVWLNLGDSYAGGRRGDQGEKSTLEGSRQNQSESRRALMTASRRRDDEPIPRSDVRIGGLKAKDLVGQPWRVAFALQADGWWLRSDIIWSKPNPMPESVYDRPTKAHEYIFLLSKSARYFYDVNAIKEPSSPSTHARLSQASLTSQRGGFKQEQYKANLPGKKSRDRTPNEILQHMARAAGVGPKEAVAGSGIKYNESFSAAVVGPVLERNRRTVWEIDEDEFSQFLAWKAAQEEQQPDVWRIPTEPFPGAHFATFPTKLVEPCILAGCPEGGTVLDPFAGSGTTLMVALRHNRNAIGIELNPEYVALARARIIADAPLLNGVPS